MGHLRYMLLVTLAALCFAGTSSYAATPKKKAVAVKKAAPVRKPAAAAAPKARPMVPAATVLPTAVPTETPVPITAVPSDTEDEREMSNYLADPALAEGLTKVVSKMQNAGGQCRLEMQQCRTRCGNASMTSGCVMECETECSACVIEMTGNVDNSLCN